MLIASPAVAPPAPAPVSAPGAEQVPPVWRRGQSGIGVGSKWTPLEVGPQPIGTEFGRGRLGLAATQGYDLYYEDQFDAMLAASYLSAGQQGAITIDRGNFIGTELRTVDVVSDGRQQVPNKRPVQYHFEELAATAAGRRQIESNLKLDNSTVVIDGAYIAVADFDGSVQVHEALAYIKANRDGTDS